MNFVQRFGSSLALNVHFHALFLDGTYIVRGAAGRPSFHPAPPLGPDELARVQRDIVRRIERVLRDRGILDSDSSSEGGGFDDSESLLPFVQAASLQSKVALGAESGRSISRLVDPAAAIRPAETCVVPPDELRCELDGYSLHAATRVEADDRERLERLVRYVARPALAQGRLEVRGDSKVKWSLRRPWRDGTRAFVFDPMTFLERLVALIPHPREHQWTYFGVLAPASPLRDAIVPRSPESRRGVDDGAPCAQARRRSWAELLERAFAVDVLHCPKCGGRRHRIATITDPLVARKILLHLGLRAEPPELAPARPEPQMRFA
ncbi:MAG: transposase [Planctomycetota bacterium]